MTNPTQQGSTATATSLYGGQVKITFVEKGHHYFIDGREVPGVTTILRALNKPALVPWAANAAAEFYFDSIKPGQAYDEVQLEAIFQAARKAHYAKRDAGACVGGLAHDWVKLMLKSRIVPGTPEPIMPVHEGARNACRAAFDWITAHLKPVATEQIVYSRELDYAGTLDYIGEVDGELAIIDWKTSSGIYPEMKLQTAAYAAAWAEEHDQRVPSRWIVRLDKETGEFEAYKAPRSEYRADLCGFLAAKAVSTWLEARKFPSKPEKAAPVSQPAAVVAPKAPVAPAVAISAGSLTAQAHPVGDLRSKPVRLVGGQPSAARVPVWATTAQMFDPYTPAPQVPAQPARPMAPVAAKIPPTSSFTRQAGDTGATKPSGAAAPIPAFPPKKRYAQPKKVKEITYVERGGQLIVMGDTYGIKDVLKETYGARGEKNGEKFSWVMTPARYGELAALCMQHGIRLATEKQGA